ncbi:glycosyltransferase [Methylibium sp.]|uniref:glycosyltransferase n=1 Tax=Methylibium sp. TaxID=2067992 RepID=UPI003BAA42BF
MNGGPDDRRTIGTTARVAFVIKTIVGRAGGAEKVLCNAANALADAGARVTVYHGDEPGRPFFPLRSSIDVISVRPKDRPIRAAAPAGAAALGPGGRLAGRHRFPRSLLTWWREHAWWIAALRRFLRAARPDVVIAFQPSATTDTLIATVGTGIPVVPSLHNVPEQDFERPERWDPNPLDRWLRKRMLRRAARITVLLDEFRAWFPSALQGRLVVLPNAVHVQGPPAEPMREDPERNRIIVVGRLAPAKDHACLVEAWARIHATHPRWQVEIYGGGPLRKALQTRIAERGVGSTLLLCGESDAVMAHYARAKIFCIPSLFEGFGLVTAEALAKGLPAVGFADCPGTNSLIRHEHNGLLADPSDHSGDRAAALAAALERLMVDAELRARLGAAGPASMLDYRPEAVARRWVALIDDILPPGRVSGGAVGRDGGAA